MINWYPGHMAKATRQIAEVAKQIDIVIEIADARCPLFSRCKEIPELANKPHLLLLNKKDLCVERKNVAKETTIYISCKNGVLTNQADIVEAINALCKEKINRNIAKGMNKPLKMIVIGIPNVGKSAFINAFAKKGTLTVGNRPGVTRTPQWLRIENYELLDTPGVLAPRLDSEKAGYVLSWLGCIKDEVVDIVEVASKLAAWLQDKHNSEEKKSIPSDFADLSLTLGYEKLLEFGRENGCLMAGGQIDEERAAKKLLQNFRSGKMGKVYIE